MSDLISSNCTASPSTACSPSTTSLYNTHTLKWSVYQSVCGSLLLCHLYAC